MSLVRFPNSIPKESGLGNLPRIPPPQVVGGIGCSHPLPIERIEISTPALHAVVNSCSLVWGIPAMKLRKISGLMKELQEAIKTTKAYWPSLKQMRKNRHGKRDSRVSERRKMIVLYN